MITKKMIESDLSGHLQRVIRQGLTATAGYLIGKGFLESDPDQIAASIDKASGSASELIAAVLVAVAAYLWSSVRASTLLKK